MLSGDPANKPLNRIKREGNEGLEEGREKEVKREGHSGGRKGKRCKRKMGTRGRGVDNTRKETQSPEQ